MTRNPALLLEILLVFVIAVADKVLKCAFSVFKVQLTLEYQFSSTFSNMNIFGSIMSTESMIQRTLGGGHCSSPGDYLR